MKKYISAGYCIYPPLCILFVSSQNNVAQAEYKGSIAVDTEHFPDEAFRRIATKFDQDTDGLLKGVELRQSQILIYSGLLWTRFKVLNAF